MIQVRKFKKVKPHQDEHHVFSRNKNSRASKHHYQIKNRVYGDWADDWLTAWQRKNEG